MRLRISLINRKGSDLGEPRVTTRIEFSWLDEGEIFFNTGPQYYSEDEFSLLLALLILGARAASVQIEYKEVGKDLSWTTI